MFLIVKVKHTGNRDPSTIDSPFECLADEASSSRTFEFIIFQLQFSVWTPPTWKTGFCWFRRKSVLLPWSSQRS